MRRVLFNEVVVQDEYGTDITLQYYLLVDSLSCGDEVVCESYGIFVLSSSDRYFTEESVPNVTTNAEQIYSLLELVHTHSVMPGMLKDVLVDVL